MKILSSAWRNIRRSPYQAIAAIFIMIITFFAFSVFALFILGFSRIIDYFESTPQVTAFFRDEAKVDDINNLQKSLEDSGLISTVDFVSKEKALEIYTEQNKDEPLLLDLVTAEVLPASLEISTYNIDDLSLVSETLEKSTIVENVIFQKDVIDRLTAITNATRILGIFIVSVLAVASIFIMVTIVGIKVSQKKDDIETMKLIGAGNWYIRWPFIFEGAFYGIFGALAGWMISMGILFWAAPSLASFFIGIPIFPISPLILLGLLGLEILLAILLGVFSSYVAVLRYLRRA